MPKILAIDIGNTNADFGLFEKERLVERHKIPTETLDQLDCVWKAERRGLRRVRPAAVVVASVRPQAIPHVLDWAERTFRREAVVLGVDCPVPIPVRVRNPARVGIDRLLNAYAAFRLVGGPAIVIDAGTAVTFDVVSEKGEFLGGAIAPGITVSAGALHRDCAQLPLVEWRALPEAEMVHAIGKDTEEAMKAGLFWGLVGMATRVIAEIEAEFGRQMRLIATGGDAHLIASHLRGDIIVAPDLTLKGIVLAYESHLR